MKLTALAMAVALLAAVGCQDGAGNESASGDGASQASSKKPKAPPKAASADAGDEVTAFVYDREVLRDPFRSFEWERPDRMQQGVLRGPLEQFDVSQLSVVGVVWKVGRARALVTDPAGESYIVAEGTRIGKNEGRVIDIGDNTVIVRETYVDYLGEKTTKDVEMRIRRTEGG